MRVIVFANGVMTDPQGAKALLGQEEVIIAADGGAAHCRTLDLTPNVINGDMDSVSTEDVEYWSGRGVTFIRHDRRKDETDLELALLYALSLGADEALVLGGLGGRWDQSLANLMLPIYHRLANLDVTFWHEGTWVYAVSESRVISGRAGQTVSLIPVGGDARGVRTSGLEWPLDGETLFMGGSRGVSNLLIGGSAEIKVDDGALLCFVFEPQKEEKNT